MRRDDHWQERPIHNYGPTMTGIHLPTHTSPLLEVTANHLGSDWGETLITIEVFIIRNTISRRRRHKHTLRKSGRIVRVSQHARGGALAAFEISIIRAATGHGRGHEHTFWKSCWGVSVTR